MAAFVLIDKDGNYYGKSNVNPFDLESPYSVFIANKIDEAYIFENSEILGLEAYINNLQGLADWWQLYEVADNRLQSQLIAFGSSTWWQRNRGAIIFYVKAIIALAAFCGLLLLFGYITKGNYSI